MITELIFRAAFWILLGSLWVMRVYFIRRVRQPGEHPAADKKAIEVIFRERVGFSQNSDAGTTWSAFGYTT